MKLGLAAIALFLAHFSARAIAQPEIRHRLTPCQPSAQLSGEESLVAELEQELTALGISTSPQPSPDTCPHVRATIERVSTGLFVSMSEPNGRTAYRRLSDSRIAAIWIDSWLQDDLSDSLLAVRTIAPQFHDGPATALSDSTNSTDFISSSDPTNSTDSTSSDSTNFTETSTGVSASANESVNMPRNARSWELAIHYDSANDRTSMDWQGVKADICVHLSIACIGFEGRISEAQESILDPENLSTFSQSSMDVLFQIRAPISVGRAILAPHLAFGLGRIKSVRSPVEPCNANASGNCDSEFDETPATRISWAPRAEAGISLSLPVTSDVHIQLGTSFGLRPFGKGIQQTKIDMNPQNDDLITCDDPNTPVDPSCDDVPPPTPIPSLLMPADPSRFLRFSIGLQVQI